jgi:hypothetical protein
MLWQLIVKFWGYQASTLPEVELEFTARVLEAREFLEPAAGAIARIAHVTTLQCSTTSLSSSNRESCRNLGVELKIFSETLYRHLGWLQTEEPESRTFQTVVMLFDEIESLFHHVSALGFR